MTATPHPVLDRAARPSAAEAALTLLEPAPRVLSFWDQLGFWGNLGVSLLGPVGAIFVLQPQGFAPMPLVAALLAVVVGTVLGTALLAFATVPGVHTGQPSMVLLRGLFGARVSDLPTALNIVQLLGWGIFEVVVITAAAQQLLPWHRVRWPYIVVAGVLTTVMAIRPLGSVRVLRRYALVAVTFATIYLFAQLLRHGVASTGTSWSGFWPGADYVIAAAVSFVPLASDYSRHSRTVRAAVAGSFLGYGVSQIAYYALGLLALATVVKASAADLQHDIFGAFLAVPVGWLAFGILTLRELDQCFADAYSTVVSAQNVGPRVDRRVFAIVVGALTTAGALWLTIGDYVNFLTLLGSVFVPMFAVFLVDYFGFGGGRSWNTSTTAPARWAMLVPWLLGVAVYHLVYSPDVGGWDEMWQHVRDAIGFTWHPWMSASLLSFAVAAGTAVPFAALSRRRMTARSARQEEAPAG